MDQHITNYSLDFEIIFSLKIFNSWLLDLLWREFTQFWAAQSSYLKKWKCSSYEKSCSYNHHALNGLHSYHILIPFSWEKDYEKDQLEQIFKLRSYLNQEKLFCLSFILELEHLVFLKVMERNFLKRLIRELQLLQVIHLLLKFHSCRHS